MRTRKTLHSFLKRSPLSPGTASYLGADVRRRLLLPYNAVQARQKKKTPTIVVWGTYKKVKGCNNGVLLAYGVLLPYAVVRCSVFKLQGGYSLDSARTTEKVFLKLINSTLHKLSTFAD